MDSLTITESTHCLNFRRVRTAPSWRCSGVSRGARTVQLVGDPLSSAPPKSSAGCGALRAHGRKGHGKGRQPKRSGVNLGVKMTATMWLSQQRRAPGFLYLFCYCYRHPYYYSTRTAPRTTGVETMLSSARCTMFGGSHRCSHTHSRAWSSA